MWEIFSEKLGTDEFVAKYINEMGAEAFKVMEANGTYFSIPNYTFIDRCYISNDEVLRHCKDTEKNDEKFKLTIACGLIGRNYRNQAGVIAKDFI